MTLNKYPILFGGGLGLLRINPVHLTLRDNAKPVHARAFPIPQSLLKTTKTEIKWLTKIDVFEKAYDSEWAAHTFVHPKKTGDVRILTDFHVLNACLKRTPFPLPIISDWRSGKQAENRTRYHCAAKCVVKSRRIR
jgi:hypothetical protein